MGVLGGRCTNWTFLFLSFLLPALRVLGALGVLGQSRQSSAAARTPPASPSLRGCGLWITSKCFESVLWKGLCGGCGYILELAERGRITVLLYLGKRG